MPSTTFAISLDTLVYRSDLSRRRQKQPYLWTAFFQIDGSTIRLSQQFELVGQASLQFGAGSHGNLGQQVFAAGDAISIPPEIGQWQVDLHPLEVPFFNYSIPGIIGIVAVLMQERSVSDNGAEAGHEALNQYLTESIGRAIQEFDVKHIDVENIQPSLKRYFADQVATLADGIEGHLRKAIINSQSWVQNLWSLIDQDELIGYCVYDLTATDVPEGDTGLALKQAWTHPQLGDWELIGSVRRVS
jgi:hypothetical protein